MEYPCLKYLVGRPGKQFLKTASLILFGYLYSILFSSNAFGQCPGMEVDTLAITDFEAGIPEGWTAEEPTDGGVWRVDAGRIGYYNNPGSSKWLYLNDEAQDNIGKGIFLSPDFDLSAYSAEVFLEFDLLFQAFEDSSYFLLELWNGKNWIEMLRIREDFSGRLEVDLSGIPHDAVQLRFTYDDEGTWAWGMGLDNLLLYALPSSCGNGICDPGESLGDCSDCEDLQNPAPLWVDYGKDLYGQSARYTSFNHNSPCDDCSQFIPLGFTLTFFDQPYTEIYLNTNGNLTFDSDFVEYTPSPFCLEGPKMIAPFFGDVDLTRGGSMDFYADPQRHYFIVNWKEVAYYGCEKGCERRNSFQLVLTDGSIKEINGHMLPSHTNVIFNYGDMEWTTGESSGGVDGLGGSAATVGMNMGNGVICIDYGTFDAEGYGYRGNSQELACPPNEVSHLDYRSIALDGENGSLLEQDGEIPDSDSLIIAYSSDEHSNLFFWKMKDSSYTQEFVLFRGELPDQLYEILRLGATEAYNSDSQRFEITDSSPLPNHLYYLLKEIRINGEENKSDVLSLASDAGSLDDKLDPGFELISVGPNPFKSFLQISYNNPKGHEITYILANQLGQPMAKGSFGNQAGPVRKRLELPGIPTGKYFLSVNYPGGGKGVKLIRLD
ncbi:MAG: hypothetical protein MRZ79_10075 [Bacteroidia bacterium]|nr:hypothetical protein [Bacteroidia bacterium]